MYWIFLPAVVCEIQVWNMLLLVKKVNLSQAIISTSQNYFDKKYDDYFQT